MILTNIIQQLNRLKNLLPQFFSSDSNIMILSKIKEVISELRILNNTIIEIGKTSNLTGQQLKALENSAFQVASKYGKSANDYLTGILDMYHAGFHNAEQMSELSILAQSIGSIDKATAHAYLIASNNAYYLKGNIEELSKILDGQNNIAEHTSISMMNIAQATAKSATAASQAGIKLNELSALIAILGSNIQTSGTEIGNHLASLFTNLQNNSTNTSLQKIFQDLNISITEIVNGSENLKTPIQLLKELAETFQMLAIDDPRRTNILSNLGGSSSDTLTTILNHWASYEKMLTLYSTGLGSASKKAEESANHLENSFQRLSNTWTNITKNIANSDTITFVINTMNHLLSLINHITNCLGTLGTVGFSAAIAGISKFVKNFA